MQRSELIRLEDVHVSLRHAGFCHEVLRNINFTLREGEHVAILGVNGAGKSTFLRALAGEAWISSGNITWFTQGKAEHSPIMGRRVATLVSHAKQEAYVRHEWRLNGEDILLTAFCASASEQLLHFIPDAEQKMAVRRMAENIKATHLLHQEACTLSQGQLRLLLLGRALLRAPSVLLLDEYLDGLDAEHRKNIVHILENCQSTLVMSDHRENSILPWIQNVYQIEQGGLYAANRTAKAQQNTAKFSQVDSIAEKNENGMDATPQDAKRLQFIDIQNATVYVERKAILQNISWQWHEGEHWQIYGANGSGKSTFLRLLAGDEHIAFDGGSLKRSFARHGAKGKQVRTLEDMRRGMGLLSAQLQQTYAYDVTGLDCVLSGIDTVQGVYREYAETDIKKAQELLQRFRLYALENRRIASLSTGQFRRLLLARLFMGEPELLLLDEPFSGLDQSSYVAMRDMLEDEANAGHIHILLVSHYDEDRLACINRTCCMCNGRLVFDASKK